MSPISENQKTEIIALLTEDKLGREQIAAKAGVSLGTISAIKAHLTMGTYTEPLEAEEVIEVMETTFGLERDLQIALRSNTEQLEQGLLRCRTIAYGKLSAGWRLGSCGSGGTFEA